MCDVCGVICVICGRYDVCDMRCDVRRGDVCNVCVKMSKCVCVICKCV